jgi:hypothetical protein
MLASRLMSPRKRTALAEYSLVLRMLRAPARATAARLRLPNGGAR